MRAILLFIIDLILGLLEEIEEFDAFSVGTFEEDVLNAAEHGEIADFGFFLNNALSLEVGYELVDTGYFNAEMVNNACGTLGDIGAIDDLKDAGAAFHKGDAAAAVSGKALSLCKAEFFVEIK